jgi:hypothetical protein
MRLWVRFLILFVAIVVLAAGGWIYVYRQELARQVALSRVSAAPNYEEARRVLGWFEREPDRQLKLRALVRKWGTGNARFDRYLAQYVNDPASSDALREAFSLNLAWCDGHLSRWADYWGSRPGFEPEPRTRSLLAYLDLLLATPLAPSLTWREILDLQAIFTRTGQPHLALRLSPDNWRDRYRQWLAVRNGE